MCSLEICVSKNISFFQDRKKHFLNILRFVFVDMGPQKVNSKPMQENGQVWSVEIWSVIIIFDKGQIY